MEILRIYKINIVFYDKFYNKIFVSALCLHANLIANDEESFDAEKQAKEEYKAYVREIQSVVANEVKKDLDLYCNGTSGVMHEKIEDMGLSFIAFRRATIQEARTLHLLVIDKFVKAVNAHEKIQPFLEISPFTYEKAHVSISFTRRNMGGFCDGTVARTTNITSNSPLPFSVPF